MPYFKPEVTTKKGVVEGGAAGGIATFLMLLLGAVKQKNPELGLTPSGEAALIGVGTALVGGVFKALRNWMKHRKDRRSGQI